MEQADAVCSNVERLEQLAGVPSPAWPPRRTLPSLSVHLKLRLNRVQTAAAKLGDPAAVATLERAVAASAAWQDSVMPPPPPTPTPPPTPVPTPSAAAAAHPPSPPPAAGPDPSTAPSNQALMGTQLAGIAAVGAVGIVAGALFFRARRKIPLVPS